jgi:glycosyltransferase involved in cell wall biosynthesis
MQTNRVAILHYASPPGVGGVESTIAYHARGLTDLGYAVRVISGGGAAFDSRVETRIDPLFGSTHPEVLRIKAELDAGHVTSDFAALVERIKASLHEALEDCTICIAHNLLTLHKNLPLTAALASLHQTTPLRLVAWCHDLAWTNAQYQAELHPGYPYDLLRTVWERTRYVTVSEARRMEFAALLHIPTEQITVVVPGIDPATFFRWTPVMRGLERQLGLLDADGILLLPARITRRKNIQLGLRVLDAVRRLSNRDFRLVITGPPGPHNPANPGYLGELLALRRELEIETAAHFLYAQSDSDTPLIPDDDTMTNLYQTADALLFPSTQEGFGIPILEAGLAGIPIFCADIPPLRQTGQQDVIYFDLANPSPSAIARTILDHLDGNPAYRLRCRVRQAYRWDVLIRDQVLPLLEDG